MSALNLGSAVCSSLAEEGALEAHWALLLSRSCSTLEGGVRSGAGRRFPSSAIARGMFAAADGASRFIAATVRTLPRFGSASADGRWCCTWLGEAGFGPTFLAWECRRDRSISSTREEDRTTSLYWGAEATGISGQASQGTFSDHDGNNEDNAGERRITYPTGP